MKTRHFTLLLSTIILFTIACADESFDYKYADKADTITCNNTKVNALLLKEALYAFEDELITNYSRNTPNLSQAYSIFMSTGISGRTPDTNTVSEHTRKVIQQLKKEKNLWVIENGKYTLDYNNDLITCLGDNFLNGNLQTTFRALISTNSMSARLFGAPLRTQIRNASRDRFLATFVALDMYYSRLMDVDFSKIPLPLPEPTIDFNAKAPVQQSTPKQ